MGQKAFKEDLLVPFVSIVVLFVAYLDRGK